jgi:hypothetical protein
MRPSPSLRSGERAKLVASYDRVIADERIEVELIDAKRHGLA